jgi:hypothetical protein
MTSTGSSANPPFAYIVIIQKLVGTYWAPNFFAKNKIGGFLGVGQWPYDSTAEDYLYYTTNNFWKAVYASEYHAADGSPGPPGPDIPFLFMLYLRPQSGQYSFMPSTA